MNNRKRPEVKIEVKAALVFLFAQLFSKGLAIVTVPLFTRLMPLEEVGTVNIFTSWFSILGGVISLGLTSGGLMLCYKKYERDIYSYISSLLTLTTISTVLAALLLVMVQSLTGPVINLSNPLIVLMFIGFLVTPAYDFWISMQRYENKYKLSGIVMIVSALLSSVLAVTAVVFLPRMGVMDYAEARLFGSYSITLPIALVIFIIMIFKGRTSYNNEYWKFSLSLSIPLIGQMLAAQVLTFADRIMIEEYCGKSSAGIYSTLYTIGMITTMVWTAVNGTFTPYIYKNIGKNTEAVRKNAFLLLAFFSVVSLMVVLLGPELAMILGTEEYYEGIYIIPPVAAGVFLVTICDLYSDVLVYLEKTKFILIGTIIGAAANVILNILFIPKYGYIAAAYTTFASYSVMAAVLLALALVEHKKRELSPIYYNKKMIVLSSVTVLVDVLLVFTYFNWILRYSLISLVVIMFLILNKRYRIISTLKNTLIQKK